MKPRRRKKTQPKINLERRLATHLARRFHYLYETYAPKYGYKTRKDTRVQWSKLPQANKKLMIAVCTQILREAM